MQVKLLDENAAAPVRGSEGAAGYDLHVLETTNVAGDTITQLHTGVAVAIPAGHVGLIRDRSSYAMRGLGVEAGVIDEDYRGEVIVVMRNHTGRTIEVLGGDRVAQLLVIPVVQTDVEVVDELDDTERGDGGFGSTGD
jgi:dUTP pyrophosphatase